MKIACDQCNGTIAHVYGDKTIELVRQGHKVSVMGNDLTVMASCPNTGKCNNKVALVVENGKLILENLKQKEEKNGDDKTTPNGGSEGGDGEGDGGENGEVEGKEIPDGGGGEGKGEGDGKGEGGEPDPKPPVDDGSGKPDQARKYTKI